MITPQKDEEVPKSNNLAAPAGARHKRIHTISEAAEEDEASQAHRSAHTSLGEPFNPYIGSEIRNSKNVEPVLN